jgi:G3E family GTPase
MNAAEKIAVTVLTGFLGSGKTTLLQKALASPSMADTAVIINEVGEMGLDHLLVEAVAEQAFVMPGGCLCCIRRLDIATTIRDLIERSDRGELPAFRRLVIETSGLADPGPILYTLAADPMLGHALEFHAIVTLVDAVAGSGTIQRHPEAAAQVAVADRILLTKTDMAAPGDVLLGLLDGLNSWAIRRWLPSDDEPAALLFDGTASPAPARRFTAQPAESGAPVHTSGLRTLSLILTKPPARFEFARALGDFAAKRGEDLLRAKGLVEFSDRPGKVAVIHAVQHTIYRPRWLEGWPDADSRSRLVFITRDIEPDEIFSRLQSFAPIAWTPAPEPGSNLIIAA